MSRATLAALLAACALALLPAAASAHSLVRVNGAELAYISADATSLNTLTARVNGGDFELRDPTVDGGSDPGPCRPGDTSSDGNFWIIQVFCRSAGLRSVRVDLGEREDSATIALPLPVTLLGGPGADRLTAGPAGDTVGGGDGNDRLNGAAGADQLDGGEGVDAFEGGAGDDRVLSADGLAEKVACGDGQDRVEADTLDDVAADCESVSRREVAPPPDSASTGSDSVAPVVQAGGSTLQRLRRNGRVELFATSSERGFVSASGFLQTKSINLPISSDRRRVSVAGGGAKLTVRLKGRSLREARRALARKRTVRVRLGVVATDAAGNSASVRAPRIRLSRGGASASMAGVAAHPEPGDVDGDGVRDENDNCPNDRNGDQRDTDGDGPGDACDSDLDGDGFANDQDTCPPIANPVQDDPENPCLKDGDNDGVPTYRDNCFEVHNAAQRNTDERFQYGDNQGDACDVDDDGDGVFDTVDNCPLAENPDQTDADRDGRGYLCDADDTPQPAGGGGGGGTGSEADRTKPRVTVTTPRRQRLATVEAGLVVRVRCSEACAATVQLRAGRKLARTLRLPRSGVVARGSARVERAASTYAFVRFSKAAKRRVWKRGRTALMLHVTAVDRAGNRGRVVRSVTLLR